MELAQFVTDVLTAIMAGVQNAEGAAQQYGAVVNPREYHHRHGSYEIGAKVPMDKHAKVQQVEFDIAVTVERAGSKSGGGNISVMSIGAGGKAESSTKNASVSHVKFTLPIILPSVGKWE